MWVIAEVGNNSNHAELVTVSMSIAEAVPAGCTRAIVMILPGQTQFVMAADEQKFIVWRVRYECHSPATIQVINQTVTVPSPTTTSTVVGRTTATTATLQTTRRPLPSR